jgi:sortase A
MGDAAATVLWQEPITALRAAAAQGQLADDLVQLEAAALTQGELRRLAAERDEGRRIRVLAASLQRRAPAGEAVGRLRAPSLGLRTVVVRGSGDDALRKGPGLYDGQPFPGRGGTAAIAGHRTTFGAPFRDLDALRAGDPVVVEMPYAHFRYRVVRSRIVAPTEVSVLADRGRERLVLSACHPRFSSAQRIVVEAELVEQTATTQARKG